MDWSDLAPMVGAAAPTLGRLLGGLVPLPFGSAIGGAVGTAIAQAIGVDANPEAVGKALGSTPNDVKIAQLKEIEEEAKAKWSAMIEVAKGDATVGVAEVTTTSEVIKSELVSGTWYQRWWRPLAMYVWVSTWPFQLATLLWHISSRDPAIISQLTSTVYALTAWNAGPAALAGVYAYGRSQEKIAANHDLH